MQIYPIASPASLGLVIGTDVQAWDAVLDDLSALAVVADNEFIVGTGAGTYAHESGPTARTSIGLGPTDFVQFGRQTLFNASFSTLFFGDQDEVDFRIIVNESASEAVFQQLIANSDIIFKFLDGAAPKTVFFDASENLFDMGDTALTTTGLGTFGSLVVDTDTLVVDAVNHRVGFGTATPDELLHLKTAGSAIIKLEADVDNGVESNQPKILFSQDGGAVTGVIGYAYSENSLRIENSFNNADADIEFATQGNNIRMIVSGPGNVGIGTTTPDYILDIDAGEIGDDNYDGLRIVDTGWTRVSHPMLEFYNSHVDFNGPLARIYGEIGLLGENSKLYFAVADSSKSLQDRMVIDKDGNVGIGLTTVDNNYKLIIRRAANINLGIGLQSSELAIAAFNDALSANIPMRFYASEFNLLNGNVGIGETAPQDKLEVNGTALFKGAVKYTQDDGNEFISGAVEDGYMDYGATTAHRFGDGTNKLQISSTGDLTFVGTAGLVYGEISAYNVADTITITTAGIANKVQITSFSTNGVSNNSTPDHTNDHITITIAGHYFCTVSLHIESAGGGGADTFGFGVYKNNGATLFQNCHGHRKLAGGGGDVGAITISGIIDLAVNDTMELWTWNEDSTDDLVVQDVTLSLIQIGGT